MTVSTFVMQKPNNPNPFEELGCRDELHRIEEELAEARIAAQVKAEEDAFLDGFVLPSVLQFFSNYLDGERIAYDYDALKAFVTIRGVLFPRDAMGKITASKGEAIITPNLELHAEINAQYDGIFNRGGSGAATAAVVTMYYDYDLPKGALEIGHRNKLGHIEYLSISSKLAKCVKGNQNALEHNAEIIAELDLIDTRKQQGNRDGIVGYIRPAIKLNLPNNFHELGDDEQKAAVRASLINATQTRFLSIDSDDIDTMWFK